MDSEELRKLGDEIEAGEHNLSEKYSDGWDEDVPEPDEDDEDY